MLFAPIEFVLVSRQAVSQRHLLGMRIVLMQALTSSLRISTKTLRCCGDVNGNLHAFLTQAFDVIFSPSLMPTVDWLYKSWLI
jgi:hypothetical protein